jgi:2-succinyl-5-enolpyruvyl-6-hydroxy-3-cyclohexene-1-carboxylate synthase
VAVEANRGVNGIDGQIATFFGLALPGVENWCLIGDLTALYDLAAPWILAQRGHDLLARIVVINNGGGQIFSRIFRNDLFINRHEVSFEAWAKMWSLPYQRWTEIPREIVPVSGVEVVELVPDEAATRRFWDRYDELWN